MRLLIVSTAFLGLSLAALAGPACCGQAPAAGGAKPEAGLAAKDDAAAKKSAAGACCGTCQKATECTKCAAGKCDGACQKATACAKCAPGKCDGACKKAGAAAGRDTAKVTTAGLKKLLDANPKVIVLDARGVAEGKRLPGAKPLAAGADEKAVIAAAGATKDAQIVTYCGGLTCPASSKLAARLHQLGYTNVTEYPEGIAGWLEAGNPTE